MIRAPAAFPVGDLLAALLSWMVAAIAVSVFHEIPSIHPAARLIASLTAILAASFLHARGAFPRNRFHPLMVGAVWLALSIVSEMLISGFLGREWDGLLGPPSERLSRTVLLVAWLISPALFAHRLTFKGDHGEVPDGGVSHDPEDGWREL